MRYHRPTTLDEALVVLDLDESVDREFAEELGAAIDARSIHTVDLVY